MPKVIVDGEPVQVPEDATVLTAILAKSPTVRRSVSGEPRGPLCGMGVCFECRVTIDGIVGQKACQVTVRDGMKVDVGV